MKIKKTLWGVFFIAAAILLIVNQLGFFTNIGLWSLLFTIVLIPCIAKGIYRRNFFNLFFGVALLLIIYAKPLHITTLVPKTVLMAALFLSIGFSILIKPRHHRHCSQHEKYWREHHHDYKQFETVDHMDGNEVNCYVSLAGSCKYLHSDSLETGQFRCSLGYLKVYFDQVQLHPNGAFVTVNCSLGSMELFVPKNWKVILNVDTFLGNVNEQNRPQLPDGPTLTINGSVSLGNLEIKYI